MNIISKRIIFLFVLGITGTLIYSISNYSESAQSTQNHRIAEEKNKSPFCDISGYFEHRDSYTNDYVSGCNVAGNWIHKINGLDAIEIESKGTNNGIGDKYKCFETWYNWHHNLIIPSPRIAYHFNEIIRNGKWLAWFLISPEHQLLIHIHGIEVFGFKNLRRDRRHYSLCKLGIKSHCSVRYPAEVIDTMWAFSPIYSNNQTSHKLLYRRHLDFKGYLKSIGIPMITLEGAFEGQEYIVTEDDPKYCWDMRTTMKGKYYMRENLINVAAKQIEGWEYLLWIDAHQMFANGLWWEEAIVKMEKYGTVQFFEEVKYLSWCNNSVLNDPISFEKMHSFIKIPMGKFIPGNAWGIRKEIYTKIGYILDEGIAAGTDILWALTTLPDPWAIDYSKIYPSYLEYFRDWIKNAHKYIGGKATYIRGLLLHYDHNHYGKYVEMWKCFGMGQYTLKNALKRDEKFQLELIDPEIIELFDYYILPS